MLLIICDNKIEKYFGLNETGKYMEGEKMKKYIWD